MALAHIPEGDSDANVIPLRANSEREEALNTLPEAVGSYKSIPTYLINRFGQQREGNNEVQGELNASIGRLGVLEPILVTVMTANELEEYMDFTCRTWGGYSSLEQCIPFNHTNSGEPLYIALVGGHSRVSSIEQLALEHGENLGDNVRVEARVIPVESAVDYAIKQAAENIHSRPSPYRTIRLVASAYLFRQAQGDKISRKAFAKEMGVSEQTLRDALNYADLPEVVRSYTDKGVLPIGVSVELARALPAIREECSVRIMKQHGIVSGDGWTSEAQGALDDLLKLELFRHITAHNSSVNRGRNVVTRAQIRNHAQEARRKVGELVAGAQDLTMNLFDAREFIDMDAESRTAALRGAIESNLRDFASSRSIAARKLHNLVFEAMSFANAELVIDEPEEDKVAGVGAVALSLTLV